MRKVLRLSLIALAAGALFEHSAAAQIVKFQDNFEPPGQVPGNAVGPPQIGTAWIKAAGVVKQNGSNIVTNVALGTQSLQIRRDSTPPPLGSNGDISGISLPGAIADGQTVEVKFSHYLEDTGSGVFNDPLQVALGQVGSNFDNDFTFLDISDGGGGFPSHNYAYYGGNAAQFGQKNQSTAVASINPVPQPTPKWDTLRVDFHFSLLDATHMSGTMDFFVSLNGAPELQLANGVLLQTTNISVTAGDPDPTEMQMRLVKGPSSGLDYYDNMSITLVPEPTGMAMAAGIACFFGVRRKRS